MSNIDSSLQWFYDRKGKVTYSMTSRLGPGSYDCSSSVYLALIQGGFLPPNTWIGNTDSLYGDLERNGWVRLQPNAQGNYDTQKGDVFIWGKRGASTGGAGHTGMFVDANTIIHCSYGYNGIALSNYDGLRAVNGYPEQTFYRYVGASTPSNPVDQELEVGSTIRFDGIFAVNDLQLIGGIWQVRTNALCEADFTWEDNGIPVEPLIEIDSDEYRTADQSLSIGSRYKIPGKFQVLDIGPYSGGWLVLIEWNGLKFWVDAGPATEIDTSDGGTPVPPLRPTEQNDPSEPQPPVEQPVIKDKDGEQVELYVPPETPTKPKEETMAFTQEQQQQLNIQSQKYLDVATDVAAQNLDIVAGIPKKVKVGVYIVGDALLGAGAITPQVVTLVTTHDPLTVATTLSSLLATSGLFILTMFGIYKSGNK